MKNVYIIEICLWLVGGMALALFFNDKPNLAFINMIMLFLVGFNIATLPICNFANLWRINSK